MVTSRKKKEKEKKEEFENKKDKKGKKLLICTNHQPCILGHFIRIVEL